jgi:hypothetical protein
MPRTEDAAAESDSSNATLCGNCSKALQKPLVCARCKTATYCSKDCQVTENVSNAHTNTNVTECVSECM